jgi:phage repressor protein C with HTH and peptisase S24 domain/DNA-binding XRE family transcriptional regulator
MIRARRKEIGLTLDQLARSVECTKGYLSTIENERRAHPPSRALLEKLERALRMEPGRLVRAGVWQSTPEDVRRQVLDLETDRHIAKRLADLLRYEGIDKLHRSGELKRLVNRFAPEREGEGETLASVALPMQVPVINKVAAGYPREFTDLGYPPRIADDYVSVPDVQDPDAFAARVVGDSMEPTYREGDIVVFSPMCDTPDGADCFIRLERDDETTFKRVYFSKEEGDREVIRLQPLNSAYEARVVEREAVSGLYAAMYVVRAVGGSDGG